MITHIPANYFTHRKNYRCGGRRLFVRLSSPLARTSWDIHIPFHNQQTICRVDEGLFHWYSNHHLASDNNIHNYYLTYFAISDISLSLPANPIASSACAHILRHAAILRAHTVRKGRKAIGARREKLLNYQETSRLFAPNKKAETTVEGINHNLGFFVWKDFFAFKVIQFF